MRRFIIEQIGKGNFLGWGKNNPDTLYICSLDLKEDRNISVSPKIDFSKLGNIFYFMPLINLFFGYRQVGLYKIKRPHNFKELQEVEILTERGKIISVLSFKNKRFFPN